MFDNVNAEERSETQERPARRTKAQSATKSSEAVRKCLQKDQKFIAGLDVAFFGAF
jgi:hypothetical protein